MANFVFKAPALFDAAAVPDPNEGYLNEGPELGERLAKQKRLALWLRERLQAHGVKASEVVWDEGGWTFTVDGKNGFAIAILGGDDGDTFALVLAEIGEAKPEYAAAEAAFAAILRDRPETELVRHVP